MKRITVSGASDDLVEIKGDIREEYSPRDAEEPTKVAFSDGTVLSVVYDADGCWRVNRVADGTAVMEKAEADGPDRENYSDRVTLTGDIKWVVVGEMMARCDGGAVR